MSQTIDSHTIDRLSLWIVLAIAFFIFVMGVYQVRTTLFSAKEDATTHLAEALEKNAGSGSSAAADTQEILADQSLDSDGDGLNNFEESAQYGTSAYLVDTDSDGIGDAQEIADGTDPTCPEGGDCEVERVAGDGTTTDAEGALDGLTPTLTGEDGAELARTDMEAELLKRGATAEQLASLTDQEVSSLYLEFVQVAESGADVITNVEQTTEQLISLPIDQKRQLLVEAGIAQADVDSLSDEDIDALMLEAVTTALEQDGLPVATDTPADEAPEQPTQ